MKATRTGAELTGKWWLNSQGVSRAVVLSVDLRIQLVKTIDPQSHPALLSDFPNPRQFFAIIPEMAQSRRGRIALHHSLAGRRVIEQALRLNQQVVVWTVDDPIWIRKARTWGIVALITNNPSVLIAARESDGV